MSKKCIGCGVILQDKDENKIGYTKRMDMDYCMRCFRLNHYHEIPSKKEKIEPKKILESLNNKKGLAFFFIDFLHLGKVSLDYYKQISMSKVLVISKLDIVPSSLYKKKIENWLRIEFGVKEEIIWVQKNKMNSLKKVVKMMEERNTKDFYFLGMTNAGKSTFLNDLQASFMDVKKTLTVSEMPNTTLDFIAIKTPYGTIYDSAGFEAPTKDYITNPAKEIKPKSYLWKKEMVLLINDMVRIELKDDNRLVWFGGDDIEIQKVYQKNERLKETHAFTISVEAESHILIWGLGFLYLKEKADVTIYGVNKSSVEVMPSYMRGTYE